MQEKKEKWGWILEEIRGKGVATGEENGG